MIAAEAERAESEPSEGPSGCPDSRLPPVWSQVLLSAAAGKALFWFLDDIIVAQGQPSVYSVF